MESQFASSLVLLAGCTTAYLEGFEFDRVPPPRAARAPRDPVEPVVSRVLSAIEADLRLAGLGLVAPLAP
jgi:hypothetical protein